MKKYILLFIIFTGFSITSSSYAVSIIGHYKCGKVTSMVKDDNPYLEPVLVGYFMGFYSGRNWENGYAKETYPDSDSVYYAMIKYCEENPLKDTFDASIEIYNKLTK